MGDKVKRWIVPERADPLAKAHFLGELRLVNN